MTSNGAPWTVMRLVRRSAEYLQEKGIAEGRLDAEHLLAHTLGIPRLELYLAHDRPVSPQELGRFKDALRRRARREPLQHILGTAEFRGLTLRMDGRALAPRPETEELVEAVLAWARGRGTDGMRALDVGTGSGAIALALVQEGPFHQVVATDADPDALALAQENASALGLEQWLDFRSGAYFEPVAPDEAFDVVVSNPPYVDEKAWEGLEPEVRDWEPRGALVSGPDGLEVLAELMGAAGPVLRPGGLLALEVGYGQAGEVARRLAADETFTQAEVRRDVRGVQRIVLAERAAVPRVRTNVQSDVNRNDHGGS